MKINRLKVPEDKNVCGYCCKKRSKKGKITGSVAVLGAVSDGGFA